MAAEGGTLCFCSQQPQGLEINTVCKQVFISIKYSCHIPLLKSTAREQYNIVSENNIFASFMNPAKYNSINHARFFFFKVEKAY